MSDKLKDQVNVNDLYADPSQEIEKFYVDTSSGLGLKVEAVFFENLSVAGSVIEVQKEAPTWLGSEFDSLKIVFITSAEAGSMFALASDLKTLNITKNENLVLSKNIEPCCTIITNTKINELNQTVCTLIINYR